MDKNNAKDYLPFVQALAEGKTIQCKDKDGNWNDMNYNIGFNSEPEYYRIKPETTKWWIMPNFDFFEQFNPSIGLNYFVEEQKESYSRSRPPLKSNFNSKEEAEEWLKDYLLKHGDFQKAAKRFEIFSSVISDFASLLNRQEPIEKTYLEFKIHEFLEDVGKIDLIWDKTQSDE